uniref:Uncharacterized protein n=1 Tax=viral metagenome TaxID=1070528 RepID=A0A6M3K2T1_9ZZZZ
MVADVGFKKQLWTLDEELDVVWDWASEKWEIWRFPGQGKKLTKRMDDKAHHVMTVQTKGRSFRELGADLLLKLQKGDTHKFTLKELVAYFNQMDDNILRARERELENKIGAITLDTFDYVRGVLKIQVPREYKVQRAIAEV